MISGQLVQLKKIISIFPKSELEICAMQIIYIYSDKIGSFMNALASNCYCQIIGYFVTINFIVVEKIVDFLLYDEDVQNLNFRSSGFILGRLILSKTLIYALEKKTIIVDFMHS